MMKILINVLIGGILYACKDYGPEFCQQKTVSGEVKCLEYPCCLWEFNSLIIRQILEMMI